MFTHLSFLQGTDALYENVWVKTAIFALRINYNE